MSPSLHPEPDHRLRDDARLLFDRACDQEDHVAALVIAADKAMARAVAELSAALDSPASSVDELRRLLRAQLQRTLDGAASARSLVARAREQRVAVARLLADLDGDGGGEPARADSRQPEANTVLVVDDHSDVRKLVSRVLLGAGFVVRSAANGLEALIAAHEMRPAVIVMDVTMPVLDGLEATRLIKAAEATRHARVIAYTADPSLSRSVADKLFVAVLQKPAHLDLVLATVRQAAAR